MPPARALVVYRADEDVAFGGRLGHQIGGAEYGSSIVVLGGSVKTALSEFALTASAGRHTVQREPGAGLGKELRRHQTSLAGIVLEKVEHLLGLTGSRDAW